MLAIPDESCHRTKIADWLELKAIESPDGRVGFGTLIAAAALTENEQEENIADEDAEEDRLVEDVQEEIARRRESIGDDYPFRIDENGQALRLIKPFTKAGSIYLFCLFLSHAFDRTIVPKKLAPRVTNGERDLFQACSTVAAGGYVQGPAISFGWPRPDGSTYLRALKRVYSLFGDGTPHKRARPAASQAVKDNGVDIIAWRRAPDELPGTLYMVAQVASGVDWVDKSVVTYRRHFHDYWFERKPGSPTTDAMFMPFGLEPDLPGDGTPYKEVLVDHLQGIGYKFGLLFYRDRIARHFGDGMRLIEAGETQIERHENLPKIVKWVNNYSKRLQSA
ncbi:MAG: hypothetical protein WBE76_13095 [Terracidiphilus sp.]